MLYDEPGKGFKVEEDQLILSLGKTVENKQQRVAIPLKEARLIKDQEIRNLRIVKQQGLFFAVFTVQKIMPAKHTIKKAIAIDPNHKNLGYGVDTGGNAIEIESANWLKNFDKRIDELKAKRDRCLRKSKQIEGKDAEGKKVIYFEPSKRFKKYQETLEKMLRKRREQSKTFLYSLAHKLYKEYDLVAIGDYAPNGSGLTTKMRRAMNNRSLIDRFKQTLNWVAEKSGKMFFEYNEKGTTRTCHVCRFVVKEGLSPNLRKWECENCHNAHIRDENAAINGLNLVLRDLNKKCSEKLLVSCSDLVSITKRWAWRILPSKIQSILRGQNCAIAQTPGN